jgi:hypothetical protein
MESLGDYSLQTQTPCWIALTTPVQGHETNT